MDWFQMKMMTGSLRREEEVRRGQEEILSSGRVVLYLFFFSSSSSSVFAVGGGCAVQVALASQVPVGGLPPGLSTKMLARFLR